MVSKPLSESGSGQVKSSLVQRGIRSVLYNYLGRFVSQVIGFFVNIYVIRKLSIQVYGEYNLLFSILAYVSLFASLGLVNVFQRYIPELEAKEQFRKINTLIWWGILGRFGCTILLVSLLFVFSGPFGAWLHIPRLSEYLRIFGGVIILTGLALLVEAALNSLLMQFATNWGLLMAAILRGVGFYYVVTHQLGLKGLLIVELLSVLIRVAILVWSYFTKALKLHRLSRIQVRKDGGAIDRRRVGKYAGWAYLNDVGFLFYNTDTDNFVISNYLGNIAVGAYAFAGKVTGMFEGWAPHLMAANVITPLFFRHYAKTQDKVELNKMFNMLNKVAYGFFVPFLVGMLATHQQTIGLLFGEKYLSATWVLIGVLFFDALNAYQYPLGLVVFAIEKNQINFYSRIFSLYNLWGITGVMIATGTAITLKNLFIYVYTTRYVKLHWEWMSYFKIIINSLIMGGVVILMRGFVVNMITLALVVSLGAFVYVILTFINSIFNNTEKDLLRGFLPQKISSMPLIKRVL